MSDPNDRELLELAAKAAGLKQCERGRRDGNFLVLTNEDGDYIWNPLMDDGDSRRLQVKLRIDLMATNQGWMAFTMRGGKRAQAEVDGDEDAARMAVLRCAAEIGATHE